MTHEELTEAAERLALAAVDDPKLTPEYLEASAACRRIEWPCNPSRKRKRSMKKNQQERILDYIEAKGHITQRDALIDLGVATLTRRICDLKDAGYNIVANRHRNMATGQDYTRYSLG